MSTWHKISFLIVRFYYRISKFLWVYGMMCVWFFIYFMAVINTIYYYCETVRKMSFKLNHKKKNSLRGIQIAAERQGILLVPQGKYFLFHSRKTHFYETEFEIFRCAAAKNEIGKGNQQPKGRRLRVFNPFMPVLRYSTGTGTVCTVGRGLQQTQQRAELGCVVCSVGGMG